MTPDHCTCSTVSPRTQLYGDTPINLQERLLRPGRPQELLPCKNRPSPLLRFGTFRSRPSEGKHGSTGRRTGVILYEKSRHPERTSDDRFTYSWSNSDSGRGYVGSRNWTWVPFPPNGTRAYGCTSRPWGCSTSGIVGFQCSAIQDRINTTTLFTKKQH